MADGAEPETRRYSAFISYSRADGAAARRIHRRLEAFRLPERLHPDNDAWNPKTRHLKPVFRDRDEMGVAPDLEEALSEALGQAHFLIVLCTPASAKSEWVGREIEMFRALRGDRAILAALVEGTDQTAFHPALKHHAKADGHLVNPLAADFQKTGDGEQLALLKLIAVMAGVGLGDLVQRDAQRRTRRLLLTLAATALVLTALAALAYFAWQSREDAARQSARAGAISSYMLDDLRGNLKRYGNLGMLAEVNRGVMETFRGRDLAGLPDAELQQLAKLRQAMADDAEQRGDLAEARRQADEAFRITGDRLAAQPNDPQRIFDHGQSHYYLGLVDWRAGDRKGAETGFKAYRGLAQRLLAIEPANSDWWMEAGYAEANLGMYALRTTRNTVAAEGYFRPALEDFRTVARLRPNDRDALSSIADVYAWLGDTLRIRGDHGGALAIRMTQRRLLESMRAADPRDRQAQADLVANRLAVGRIYAARGEFQSALAEFDRGRANAIELARADPDNLLWSSQERIFDLFKLRLWLGMPEQKRPPADSLAVLNGNCSRDLNVLKSAELSDFCNILAARRNNGIFPEPANLNGDALTARWGLDFAAERALGPMVHAEGAVS